MASLELEIIRSRSAALIYQTLPDGSAAIFDSVTKNVYSLNPSAAAAWDGCASTTTLSELATAMSRRLQAPVTEDLAHEAVSELSAVGLVTVTPAERLGTSRRDLLKQVAAGVALPIVLVLTGAEQRAHAQGALSTPPTTTPPPGSSTTSPPGPPVDFTIIKGVIIVIGGTPTPLPGAMFDIKDASNVVVAQLVTDQTGQATVQLPAGTYTLVETFAPGGPYVPFAPTPFTLQAGQPLIMDRRNLKTEGGGD